MNIYLYALITLTLLGVLYACLKRGLASCDNLPTYATGIVLWPVTVPCAAVLGILCGVMLLLWKGIRVLFGIW